MKYLSNNVWLMLLAEIFNWYIVQGFVFYLMGGFG